MGFLPENYQSAGVSNYMKFKDGANKFRALDDAIFGFEWWTQDGEKRKPNRVKANSEVPAEFRAGEDKAKQFIAFPVWNYAEEKVQILEITQVSILMVLENLEINPDYGDPKTYDITVTRKGDGFDTTYTVVPSPPKENKEAIEAYKETPINLEALYAGEDPFSSDVAVDIDEILKEVE